MKNNVKVRKVFAVLLPMLTVTAFSVSAAALVLRNLSVIIQAFLGSEGSGEFDFVLIFKQVEDAVLSLHLIIPLLVGAAFSAFVVWLGNRIKNKVLYYFALVTCFVFAFAIAFSFALMLTGVNGIRFYDLLIKLIPLIDKL